MNLTGHLSSDQISLCLAGAGEPEALAHLRDCATCVARMKTVEESFVGLRHALTAHAGMAASNPRPVPAGTPRWQFALAGAVAVIALLLPVYRQFNGPAQVTQTEMQSVATTIDDDALLRDIETEVARPVTPSLQPLEVLMVAETTK